MIIYLKPTCKSSLKYGSKIEGEIISENQSLTIVRLDNGLCFRIPTVDIVSVIS